MKFSDIVSLNQFFALAAKALEGSKVIVANILIARFFGPEDFGRYSFVIGIVSLVAVIAEFRLQNVLVKEISCGRQSIGEALGSAILANTFFACIGLLIIAGYSYLERDQIVIAGLIIYSLTFLYKIPRAFRAYFISEEKNVLIAKCETISSVLTLTLMVSFIVLDFNLLWIILARSLDFFITAALLLYLFMKSSERTIQLRYSLSTAKKLTTLSAPLVLSGAAMMLFQRMDLIIVRNYLGDYSAGLYSSATTLMLLFSLVPMVISESLAPKIFRSISQENFSQTKQHFTNIIVSIGIGMSILMLASAYLLIPILYGAQYQPAITSALILSVCPILIALGSASGQIIVADGNQNKSFIKSVVACIINFLCNITLIPYFGIEGAALSTVIGLLIANYISHYFMNTYKYLFAIQSKSLFYLVSPSRNM